VPAPAACTGVGAEAGVEAAVGVAVAVAVTVEVAVAPALADEVEPLDEQPAIASPAAKTTAVDIRDRMRYLREGW
jgi:hypothetical protein